MSKSPIANASPWSSVAGGIEYSSGSVYAPSGFDVNDFNKLNAFGLAATGILLQKAVTNTMAISQIDVFGVDTLEFNTNDTLANYRFQTGAGQVIAMSTGFLTLPRAPTAPSHAVRKDYADEQATQWDNVTGGINYANGNVGIGTTNPSYNLDIEAGNVSNQFRIQQAGTNQCNMLVSMGNTRGGLEVQRQGNNPGSAGINYEGNAGYFSCNSVTGSPWTFGNRNAGGANFLFQYGGSEKMRIDTSGAVSAGGGFEVNANNKMNAFGVLATGLQLQAAVSSTIVIGQTDVVGVDTLDFNVNNDTRNYRFYTGTADFVAIVAGYVSLPLTPTSATHAVRKDYVDDKLDYYLPKAVARVSSAGGWLSHSGFSAVTRVQLGIYDLTLNSAIATDDQITQVTTDTGAVCGGALPVSTTVVRVSLVNVITGAYQDSNFSITVNDGP